MPTTADRGGAQRCADGMAGGRIPDPHGAIAICAGEQLSVGAERHRIDTLVGIWGGISAQGFAAGAAGDRIPEPHRASPSALASSGRSRPDRFSLAQRS
jgi:hypothetical protein